MLSEVLVKESSTFLFVYNSVTRHSKNFFPSFDDIFESFCSLANKYLYIEYRKIGKKDSLTLDGSNLFVFLSDASYGDLLEAARSIISDLDRVLFLRKITVVNYSDLCLRVGLLKFGRFLQALASHDVQKMILAENDGEAFFDDFLKKEYFHLLLAGFFLDEDIKTKKRFFFKKDLFENLNRKGKPDIKEDYMSNFKITKSEILYNSMEKSHFQCFPAEFFEDRIHLAKILVGIFEREAGYSCHPNDSGGETIYGVTRKFHKNFSIWKDIDVFCEEEKIIDRHKNRKKIDALCDQIFPNFVHELLGIYITYFPFSECKRSEIENFNNNANYLEYLTNLSMIYFFSFHASKQRAIAIWKESLRGKRPLHKTLHNNIKHYYDNLIVKNPKNEVFRKGWYNRLEHSYNLFNNSHL